MAFNDRAVVLACSVSLLALTLVTIYYLRNKKIKKNSHSSDQFESNVDDPSQQHPTIPNIKDADSINRQNDLDDHSDSQSRDEEADSFELIIEEENQSNMVDDNNKLIDDATLNNTDDSSFNLSFTSIDKDDFIEMKKMVLKDFLIDNSLDEIKSFKDDNEMTDAATTPKFGFGSIDGEQPVDEHNELSIDLTDSKDVTEEAKIEEECSKVEDIELTNKSVDTMVTIANCEQNLNKHMNDDDESKIEMTEKSIDNSLSCDNNDFIENNDDKYKLADNDDDDFVLYEDKRKKKKKKNRKNDTILITHQVSMQPTVNTSSLSMNVVDDDYCNNDSNEIDINLNANHKQMFASEIVSSSTNCDQVSNVCDPKTMIVNNDDSKNEDYHSKLNDKEQIRKDENSDDNNDMYTNYPDVSITPISDHCAQQQSNENESKHIQQETQIDANISNDDQSQESNDSGKGSCLLETISPPNHEHNSTTSINVITEAMAAADNCWYPSSSSTLAAAAPNDNNDNTTNSSLMSAAAILDSLPMDSQQCVQYNFRLSSNSVGFLIGRKGRIINPIKRITNTRIVIEPYNESSNICTIYGFKENVYQALVMINERFAEDPYSSVDLSYFAITPTVALPPSCHLSLPVGVLTEVILSCTIDAGHFFLQQPTHPSYPMLSILDREMNENYSNIDTPPIPQVKEGLVCAAPTAEGWFRASVKHVRESGQECDLIFVDYGGELLNIPIDRLRAINYKFLSLPFQASECRLARVQPIDQEQGWTPQANAYFEELAKGKVIHADIESYDENGIPFVNLYKLVDNHKWINIADELVKSGHAQFIVQTPQSSLTHQTKLSSASKPFWPSKSSTNHNNDALNH